MKIDHILEIEREKRREISAANARRRQDERETYAALFDCSWDSD